MRFHVALVVAMVLCCMAVPEVASALLSNSRPSGVDAISSADQARIHPTGAPSCERGEHQQRLAKELGAVEAEVSEQEDATPDTDVVAPLFELGIESPTRLVGSLQYGCAADSGHLLVSTGLGRGPPVG